MYKCRKKIQARTRITRKIRNICAFSSITIFYHFSFLLSCFLLIFWDSLVLSPSIFAYIEIYINIYIHFFVINRNFFRRCFFTSPVDCSSRALTCFCGSSNEISLLLCYISLFHSIFLLCVRKPLLDPFFDSLISNHATQTNKTLLIAHRKTCDSNLCVMQKSFTR